MGGAGSADFFIRKNAVEVALTLVLGWSGSCWVAGGPSGAVLGLTSVPDPEKMQVFWGSLGFIYQKPRKNAVCGCGLARFLANLRYYGSSSG